MQKQEALERVAELSTRIGKTELNLDRWKWERADAMHAAKTAGATTREIAAAAGVDATTAAAHIRAWKRYGVPGTHRNTLFRDAIDAGKGREPGAGVAAAREAQARTTLTNPESRRRVLDSMPAEHIRGLAIDAGIRNDREQDKHRPHPTPAEDAAIADSVDAGLAPFTGALSRIGLSDTVASIRDAAADIQQCLDNHGMTVELLDQLEAAYGELTEAMLRARELADIQSL